MGKIGIVHEEQQHWAEAEQHYKSTIASLKEINGFEDHSVAVWTEQLGSCFKNQKKYKEAEEHFLLAIKFEEAIKVADHNKSPSL